MTHPVDKERERLKPLRRFTAADFENELRRREADLKTFEVSLPEDLPNGGKNVDTRLWVTGDAASARCRIHISSGGVTNLKSENLRVLGQRLVSMADALDALVETGPESPASYP